MPFALCPWQPCSSLFVTSSGLLNKWECSFTCQSLLSCSVASSYLPSLIHTQPPSLYLPSPSSVLSCVFSHSHITLPSFQKTIEFSWLLLLGAPFSFSSFFPRTLINFLFCLVWSDLSILADWSFLFSSFLCSGHLFYFIKSPFPPFPIHNPPSLLPFCTKHHHLFFPPFSSPFPLSFASSEA